VPTGKSSRLAALALALAVAFAPPAGGAGAATEDAKEIARVENYLNSITTLRARFFQVDPDGKEKQGTLYIDRPGRLRLEYDPPVSVLMVANGSRLVYFDLDLGQVSELPLTTPLAKLLIGKRVSLGDDLEVLKIARAAGMLRLSLANKDDRGAGVVTLVFNANPLALRQWWVQDAQGRVTKVTLMDTSFGLPIDSALFEAPEPFSPGAE
jgi:outer membrane lipoprotein-sorting protein